MNKKLLFATTVSALGSFLFGFDTAVISGTTKFISQFFGLTDSSLGFTVAIALIGTVIGSIVVGKPGDTYGRKAMLFLCALLYFISAMGCAFASNWSMLLFPLPGWIGNRSGFCYGANVHSRNFPGIFTRQISSCQPV
jgi:MFS family permease